MKIVLHAILFFFIVQNSSAQLTNPYRYDTDYLSSGFHTGRREALRKQMPDNSMAIIFSAQEHVRSNDVNFTFHQNRNFYYLSGMNEPNSVLLIFKSPVNLNGHSTDEMLYISERKYSKEIWSGRMPDKNEARQISGIKSVIHSSEFVNIQLSAEQFGKVLYQKIPSAIDNDKKDSSDLFDLVEIFKTKFNFPPPNGDDFLLNKILSSLRELKEKEEITLLRKAISISCIGHMEMMKQLKPGMFEYQVEAIGEFHFRYNGAEDVGYPSICGGGENGCILHYVTNRKPLKAGDLILLDMGAEYHGYTGDVTRTLPVSGKFTTEQRIIYDLVKVAMDSAFSKCKPGNGFRDPHQAAVSVIREGLLNLGIIDNINRYSEYFMHGTSHYLGLDVHDPGSFGKLKAGNVITIEPGIYIAENSPCDPKWWNIGIRIEDDILITADGYENLSAVCPSDADSIEAFMKNKAP